MHELLDAAAGRRPDDPAVCDKAGHDSYGELVVRSQVAADWLICAGVRPGDRVAVLLPPGRDMTALTYGVFRTGAALVPVSPQVGRLHLEWILRDSAPALVVCHDKVSDVQALTAVPVVSLQDLARHGATVADRPAPLINAGDPALLMYTSGSTTMPRAVVCPHERVRFVVDAVGSRLGYTSDDVILCRLPMSFDYGLYQLFLAAAVGAQVAFRPDLPMAATLAAARAVRATVLPLVPTMTAILLRIGVRDRRPTDVRLVTNTGEALSAAHARSLRVVFPNAAIVPMYGMTECKRITIGEPDEDLRHPDSVGRPLDGTEVLVVDSDGTPLDAGQVGEIWVKGPHVMRGYWRSASATAQRFHRPEYADRMLRSGDHGYLDSSGRLYFVGRRDDIFKRRGVRTSVTELEAAILSVAEVVQAAVLPPGPDGELVAWIVGDITPRALLAELTSRVEPAKVPDRFIVSGSLPLTENGKIDKRSLRSGDLR
ncbi:class I adenylate-forming enzyme family protein [Micromonospora sp. NPDC005652]|uniref:class I adenylate-forming enzyme family protein n=1 Tax=Micromonospora sp. NPDC005652 TaxID=3157046 RepID=UPI0033CE9D1D